jgi:uncharacterized protein DUF551
VNWISVKDKLPPDYQEVLYLAIWPHGMATEIMTGHLEKGKWMHCCLFYSTHRLNNEVEITHWMELPDYPETSQVISNSRGWMIEEDINMTIDENHKVMHISRCED